MLSATGVAGVDSPAFVERRPRLPRTSRCARVSPGLTPRPSLSVDVARRGHRAEDLVSPGLTPRPSLSVASCVNHDPDLGRVAGVDSPAFVERMCPARARSTKRGVAGVDSPAFVERGMCANWTCFALVCRRG